MNPRLNKKVKKDLDAYFKGYRGSDPEVHHGVKHILIGALRDANFHSEAKKVDSMFPKAKQSKFYGKSSMEDSIEQNHGEPIAKAAKWDGHDIIDAIAFFVSMFIGGPVGAKVTSLKEGMNENFRSFVTQYIKEVTHSHEYEDMSSMGEDENDVEEVKVGEYQSKYFHICAHSEGASELYKNIESKGVDMDIAERSVRLQDALFFIEEHIQREGYNPERDYSMVANNIAKNIMKMAKIMGLEQEHSYIQSHVDTIEQKVNEINNQQGLTEGKSMDTKSKFKVYDKLKKGDEITIKYGSSMSSGNEAKFKVTKGKTLVGKQKVERIILQNVANPKGVKYYLYQRNGNVTMAIGNMAATIEDINESVVNEKLTRGLKPLLKLGSTITKNAGEDALLDLSDKFDRIDDEYAGTIASWLDMAIELMQDGYAGAATKKLKQFNKACKDVLSGKEIGSAFESVNEGLKHNDMYTMLDIAAGYSSTQDQAAGQMWSDEQDLYDYLKSDHIPKKYHKKFYNDIKRRFKDVNESVNEAKEPEVITQLRKIVKDSQNDLIKDTKSGKKVRVDMNSANLIVQVYDALKKQSNKDKFVKSGIAMMGHTAYKLMKKENVSESGIMYKAGVKKYGKEGMTKIQSAAGKGEGHEEIGKIKDKYDKSKNESVKPLKTSASFSEVIQEAEYQGRKVELNKPMQGDTKKFKVYVKNDKGNVVKVNFGQKGMVIKKDNPGARKSFRARMNCDTPGPKWKARYWSCKKW